jgi:hypothetical protein
MTVLEEVKITSINNGYMLKTNVGNLIIEQKSNNDFIDPLFYSIKEGTEISNNKYCYRETEKSPILCIKPFKNNGKFIMLCDGNKCYYVVLVNNCFIKCIEEHLFNDITINNFISKLEF